MLCLSKTPTNADVGRSVMAENQDDSRSVNPFKSPDPSTASRTSPLALTALGISYFLISVLGCGFIYTFWADVDVSIGIIRSGGFVAIMGGVHFLGYRLWRRQQPGAEIAPEDRRDGSIWSREVPRVWLWLLALLLLLLWSMII